MTPACPTCALSRPRGMPLPRKRGQPGASRHRADVGTAGTDRPLAGVARARCLACACTRVDRGWRHGPAERDIAISGSRHGHRVMARRAGCGHRAWACARQWPRVAADTRVGAARVAGAAGSCLSRSTASAVRTALATAICVRPDARTANRRTHTAAGAAPIAALARTAGRAAVPARAVAGYIAAP